uniref:Uncharacterized protein n=1 Tax=Wuchereria bancrofti TaxID=6293 RepID=A0A1I8EMR2_WUCBA
MKALKEEMETNRYMINEKLPKEIEAKRVIVANLRKVVEIADINKNDIAELQQKIDKMNQEIMDLVNERDRKDENTDKLSIYRHQASVVYKKKEKLVEKLQEARFELQNITNMVETKKNNLREKDGTDYVITTTQFKNYVSKLRTKTSNYKRMHAEISGLKNEHAVLSRTADILANQWNTLMQKIEKNGGRIIEISSISSDEKFEIAKPEIDDTEKLRDMINESNEQIDLKKITIDTLKQTNMKLNKQLTDATERFNMKKQNYEMAEANFENAFVEIEENVKNMKDEMATKKRKIFHAEIELKVMKTVSEKIRQEGLKLISQIENEISRVNNEVEILQSSNQSNGLSVEEATAQVAMWRSLMKIFQLKLQVAEAERKNGIQKGVDKEEKTCATDN